MKINKTYAVAIGIGLFVFMAPIASTYAKTDNSLSLQAKIISGIDARIAGLTSFIERVTGKKLGGGDKSQIIAGAQAELTALANSKAKISTITDPTALKAEKAQMQAQYLSTRISSTVGVMTLHAEGMEKRTDLKNEQAARFETQIAALAAQGKDVALLQSQLTTLKAKLADADEQYEKAEDMIAPISTTGSDVAVLKSNKAALAGVHSLIHIGGQDLKDATALIKLMNQEIKALSK